MGDTAYAITMLARLRGEGLLHTLLKKQQSINSPPKPISPVSHNQFQCSEKQSGSNKCETSTSEDSEELEAHEGGEIKR
jgi:hypothetical protein